MVKNTNVLVVFFVKNLTTLFSTFYDFQKCLIQWYTARGIIKFLTNPNFALKVGFLFLPTLTYNLLHCWLSSSYVLFGKIADVLKVGIKFHIWWEIVKNREKTVKTLHVKIKKIYERAFLIYFFLSLS